MASTEESGGGRISVSRDALRAELAEFKLQLLGELRVELDRKASRATVDALETRVAALERTQADSRAISVHNDAMFSKREKVFAMWISGGGLLLAVVTVTLARIFG